MGHKVNYTENKKIEFIPYTGEINLFAIYAMMTAVAAGRRQIERTTSGEASLLASK